MDFEKYKNIEKIFEYRWFNRHRCETLWNLWNAWGLTEVIAFGQYKSSVYKECIRAEDRIVFGGSTDLSFRWMEEEDKMEIDTETIEQGEFNQKMKKLIDFSEAHYHVNQAKKKAERDRRMKLGKKLEAAKKLQAAKNNGEMVESDDDESGEAKDRDLSLSPSPSILETEDEDEDDNHNRKHIPELNIEEGRRSNMGNDDEDEDDNHNNKHIAAHSLDHIPPLEINPARRSNMDTEEEDENHRDPNNAPLTRSRRSRKRKRGEMEQDKENETIQMEQDEVIEDEGDEEEENILTPPPSKKRKKDRRNKKHKGYGRKKHKQLKKKAKEIAINYWNSMDSKTAYRTPANEETIISSIFGTSPTNSKKVCLSARIIFVDDLHFFFL